MLGVFIKCRLESLTAVTSYALLNGGRQNYYLLSIKLNHWGYFLDENEE